MFRASISTSRIIERPSLPLREAPRNRGFCRICRFIIQPSYHLFIAFIFFRPTWLVASVGHTNLPLYSACCLHPSKPEHRWSRLRFTPLRLTTASAFGSRDCRLRLHYRLHRHRSCVTVSGRCHCAWDNKLSWHLHFRFLIDTEVKRRCRCSPIPMRPETSACFSDL